MSGTLYEQRDYLEKKIQETIGKRSELHGQLVAYNEALYHVQDMIVENEKRSL